MCVSSRGPIPMQQARGIPWTLPLGLVAGVFMSACASIQIRPSLSWVSEMPRHAGDGADRDRVIAPQHHRDAAVVGGLSTISASRVQVWAICGNSARRGCRREGSPAERHARSQVFHLVAQPASFR